jgi:hypothetical protein
MLIPQFSLRWLLGVTTLSAGVFSIFALAINGSIVAAAISVAILSLVVVILVHAAWFGLIWVLSVVGSSASARSAPPELLGNAPAAAEPPLVE